MRSKYTSNLKPRLIICSIWQKTRILNEKISVVNASKMRFVPGSLHFHFYENKVLQLLLQFQSHFPCDIDFGFNPKWADMEMTNFMRFLGLNVNLWDDKMGTIPTFILEDTIAGCSMLSASRPRSHSSWFWNKDWDVIILLITLNIQILIVLRFIFFIHSTIPILDD